jgi:hypothetical protein
VRCLRRRGNGLGCGLGSGRGVGLGFLVLKVSSLGSGLSNCRGS